MSADAPISQTFCPIFNNFLSAMQYQCFVFHSKTTTIIFSLWSANCHITLIVERFAKMFSSCWSNYFLLVGKILTQSFAKIFSVNALQRSSLHWSFCNWCFAEPHLSLWGWEILPMMVSWVLKVGGWGGLSNFSAHNRGVLAISCVKFCSNLEAWQRRKLESWTKNTITWYSRKFPLF